MYTESTSERLTGTARFEWDALDSWFEEDEEVFVHPRNPYTRVDALRSTRHVRIELDGVILAESSSPVMVFETGLPTRYYFNPTELNLRHLVATNTVTSCPYKGTTTYWSGPGAPDVAWSYEAPLPESVRLGGYVSFDGEGIEVSES